MDRKNGTKFGLFIGESKLPGGEFFETLNPATGEVLATICQAKQEDVDRAMNSAAQAQADWEGMGGPRRAKYLYALAQLAETFTLICRHRNLGQW